MLEYKLINMQGNGQCLSLIGVLFHTVLAYQQAEIMTKDKTIRQQRLTFTFSLTRAPRFPG